MTEDQFIMALGIRTQIKELETLKKEAVAGHSFTGCILLKPYIYNAAREFIAKEVDAEIAKLRKEMEEL